MKRILFFFISVVCIFTISACASSAADTTEYEQTGVIRLCRPGYPEEPGYLGYYDYIEVYDEMLEGAMFVDDIGYVFDKFKRIEEE